MSVADFALISRNCVAAAPAVASIANGLSKETYASLADTLVKLEKAGSNDMILGGLQRLADVAQRLKSYKSIQTLNVFGYTDRLDIVDCNDKLSEARAKTVQAYLDSLSVKSAT